MRLTQKTLMTGVNDLVSKDQDLADIVSRYGPPPIWEREPGFSTLVHIILEQQISLASAEAAFNRLLIAVDPLTPEGFLELSERKLREIGFSRQKSAYCRGLAKAVVDGSLDLHNLSRLDSRDAAEELMRLKGIGPWTANIYMLMAEGHPDIWPRGDLALAVAVQHAKGWSRKPTDDELAELSDEWRPWRSVAARILWHFYLSERNSRSP
jgi:DNA-3-methyladenine glycosylase II